MHLCTSRMPRMLTALLLGMLLFITITIVIPPLSHGQELRQTFTIDQYITEKMNDALETKKHDMLVDEAYAQDFYFAQAGSGRCTITSVAMMVRRAAFLDDDVNWQDVDAGSVTADGWTSAGVKNSFSTAGFQINYISIAGTESLIQLLKEHPEGIAAYDPGVPHAVLLTDYDEETGTFYCADPAGYYSGKRIPLADSWNGERRGGQAGAVAGFATAWIIQR